MRFDWKAVLGVLLSILLLWWALRDVDATRVLGELRRADPWYFVAAVAVTTSGFVVRAWRWKGLLAPLRAGSAFPSRFAAVNIGFMANNVLPARVGEFARAYALSRLEPVTVSGSLGSLVVERILDGLILITLLLMALAAPTFPAGAEVAGIDLRHLMAGMGSIFLGAGVLLFAVARWSAESVRVAERLVAWLPGRGAAMVDIFEAFLDGVAVLRSPALLLKSVLWTLVLWTWMGVSYQLAFAAFGIDVDFFGALFLQTLIGLAVAVPSAPGFFGPFEAAAKVGLVGVYGVDVHRALSFAIGFHIGGFIPVTLLGLWYAWRLGLSFREVEKSEELVEEAVEREHPEVVDLRAGARRATKADGR
ncbi:MAG: flippase-like domain-containing protein [Gemmatimonadetes bacterium]|nr:flippase-like domain-containing protein [Gemmatimonadota bacterium]